MESVQNALMEKERPLLRVGRIQDALMEKEQPLPRVGLREKGDPEGAGNTRKAVVAARAGVAAREVSANDSAVPCLLNGLPLLQLCGAHAPTYCYPVVEFYREPEPSRGNWVTHMLSVGEAKESGETGT